MLCNPSAPITHRSVILQKLTARSASQNIYRLSCNPKNH
jgi:hypothetical protein